MKSRAAGTQDHSLGFQPRCHELVHPFGVSPIPDAIFTNPVQDITLGN